MSVVRVMAALALTVAMLTALASHAEAHPLGNFSVNRYSRIEIGPARTTLRYVLDLAEIPTLQELSAAGLSADAPADTVERAILAGRAARIASSASLMIDGHAALWDVRSASLEVPDGQAGLRTMRIALTLAAQIDARDGARIEYRDGNEPGRTGWHEVVLLGRDGVAIAESTAPARDRTDELRHYPADPTSAPLDVDRASGRVRLGTIATSPDTAAAPIAVASRWGIDAGIERLTGLLRDGPAGDVSALVAALMVAAFLGAVHALGPGHGKAIVGAYLVGSRGTPWYALLLGATVTATHTAGVYALGLLTLVAAPYVLPERLYPILGGLSGSLVVGIGVSMAWARLRELGQHDHDPAHGHADGGHGHAPSHDHGDPGGDAGLRSVLALGVSGGLLPCPTALVVLLAAISFHNVALGMALVAAFSAGVAAVLTGIGLLMVGGGRALARSALASHLRSWSLVRVLPALSGIAIAIAGLVIALDALRALA